ncbi:MAG: 3-hydroxyacyl-CoA dehydrogenase family protein [Myxococcota bacterium]
MKIGVVGAGTMGHGIAQVCAMAGHEVVLTDVDAAALERAMAHVKANLDKGVDRGKVEAAIRDRALAQLSTGPLERAAADAAIVIEAVPERLPLKVSVLKAVEAVAPASCIFGTNTSSLSIAGIAQELDDPGRVIGTHFFNPVHVMKLLEVVIGASTRDAVQEQVIAFGEAIGKEVIVVKDRPGFATSRLGVCLGMEAIRMVEEGVASAEHIDKAMELGYRHPMGPLRLTDLVGLDVRLNIGRYLAKELGNPAFEPPALLVQLVEEGKLGQKSGQGFYDWSKKA